MSFVIISASMVAVLLDPIVWLVGVGVGLAVSRKSVELWFVAWIAASASLIGLVSWLASVEHAQLTVEYGVAMALDLAVLIFGSAWIRRMLAK